MPSFEHPYGNGGTIFNEAMPGLDVSSGLLHTKINFLPHLATGGYRIYLT
ncbi:hypothetical protein Holit_00789 [Hollandina sp. SP2]